MTEKIYKYPLKVVEVQELELPVGADIIRAETIDGLGYLWAIVRVPDEDDEEIEMETVTIEAYKTGQPLKRDSGDLGYLGLCKFNIMQELGLYMFKVLT